MVATDRRFCSPVFLIVVLSLLMGCSGPGSIETPQPSNADLPGFSLTDVNANSSRYHEAVAPREYLGQISDWYFGHST